VRELIVDSASRDVRDIHKQRDAEQDPTDRPELSPSALIIILRAVFLGEIFDLTSYSGVDDHFEQTDGGAECVSRERDGRACTEERIEDVVWVGCETDEDEEDGTAFYCAEGGDDGRDERVA